MPNEYKEKAKSELDPWSTKPNIGGFSPEEIEQIYSGNFAAVLERFKKMAPQERDAAIISSLPGIGRASYELAAQLDIAVDEWKDQKRAKKYTVNLKNLDAFNSQLVELFRS